MKTYEEIIELLNKEEVLTSEEEQLIFEYYEKTKSKDIRNLIIIKNMGLIAGVIKQYQNLGIEYEDLHQQGTLGLFNAIEGFEWRKGFKFSTYACNHIRASVQRYVQNTLRRIRIPCRAQERLYQIFRFMIDFEKKTGEAPSVSKISEELGFDEDTINTLMQYNNLSGIANTDCTKHYSNNESELDVMDILKDEKAEDMFDEVLNKANEEKLWDIIKGILTDKEYRVLRLRMGVDGAMPMTFAAISEIEGYTKQYAQMIESSAIRKLRHPRYMEIFKEFQFK